MTEHTSTSKPGWLLCLSGANFAISRTQECLDRGIGGNDAEALRGTCEAIWWIVAAEEMLLDAHDRMYRTARADAGWDEVMSGLRWARNRITHQESQWKIIEPPFNWANEQNVPQPLIVRHDRGRDNYRRCLQGRPVIARLREMVNFLREYAMKFRW